jgi:hypothetical protein
MKKVLPVLFICLTAAFSIKAQDTLPKFSVKNAGNNRIIVSWTNNFQTIKQLSIQRSFDSLNNFKTILTVPDPANPQNGYVDSKATNDHMFYRLYILLDKGVYIFSDAKRPVIISRDSLRKVDFSNKTDHIGKFDSISTPNLGINEKERPEVFVPSMHVYTYKDGFVRINLPDGEDKKYSIKFFEDNDDFLFELKDIKERTFRIDKSDFYHAGWFKFELYENGKLIEKHKFYLEKDF